MIKLGDKVKDSVTGFSGTAVARAEYLHGNPRVAVAALSHDGKDVKEEWMDEGRLEGINETTA